MPRKKKAYTVEYHPEFLYFNTLVREKKYSPDKHPSVWGGSGGEYWGPYQIFNTFLFDFQSASGKVKRPWNQFCKEVIPKLKITEDTGKNVDIDQWLKYAKSLNIESMLDKYLPRMFRVFGSSFSVPTIKISPIRLNPCLLNHFRAICSGSYSLYHVSHGDPAFYDVVKHIIYLPVPEYDIKLPLLILESVLLHELFHSVIRPLLGEGFRIGKFNIQIQKNVVNRAFAEVFANAGAYIILEESGDVTKQHRLSAIKNFSGSGGMLYVESFAAIKFLGLSYIASLLSPVFSVAQNLAFLTREYSKTQHITEKKARGILTKKYKYKKRVKGMDKKALTKRLEKHVETRINSVVNQIQSLDINKILSGALARERNPYRKRLLGHLSELFNHKREEEWARSGIIGRIPSFRS